jgi:hypothetical protein
MAGLERAYDRRGNDRITPQPRERDLRSIDAPFRCNFTYRIDDFLIALCSTLRELGRIGLGFRASG